MNSQILTIIKGGAKLSQNHVNAISSQLTRIAFATPSLLLGPPEIRKQLGADDIDAPPQLNSGDPFMDIMVSNYNEAKKTPIQPPFSSFQSFQPFQYIRPQMGLTENGSPTFLTSGNPCLDFFFQVVPDTLPENLTSQLQAAWASDPLTTLKLIFNLRGVRGTGKSDKEGFYTAAFWLYSYHSKTLAANMASVAAFGYFKDLSEILYRLIEGEGSRKAQKSEWERIKPRCYIRPGRVNLNISILDQMGIKREEPDEVWLKFVRENDKLETEKARKLRLQQIIDMARNAVARFDQDSEVEFICEEISKLKSEILTLKAAEKRDLKRQKARALKYQKKFMKARRAVTRYNQDSSYRLLHDRISDIFAECLISDMECLKKNERDKISLAAKWCPSLDSSLDKTTLLCESIARKVFPRELYPEYQGIEEAHYAYRVRERLRKEVYVPLRRALELPELYMSDREWNSLPYNRVASVAMTLYEERFLEKDGERFKKYLEDVKAGKSKIAAGALLPHQIVASLEGVEDYDGGEVAELQWKRMVEDLVKLGKLRNCLAVCDVSGSMDGTPMDVSVALGLLVSELSEEPWKGKVITFSANPELHLIKGDDLMSKCAFVRSMEWGMNTDFQKVFDLILQVAVNGKLKPEQMIKRIFVFSDMEFDQASGYCGSSWETDYEVIQRKYREKGYGDAVPQIVFWNLRDSRSTPVPGTQPGVALLSGFSKNLLKMFLDDDGKIRPDLIMEKAISGKEYQHLVVVD